MFNPYYLLDVDAINNQDFTPCDIHIPFAVTSANITTMTASLIYNATAPISNNTIYRVIVLPSEKCADDAEENENIFLPAFIVFVDAEKIYFNTATSDLLEAEKFAENDISDFQEFFPDAPFDAYTVNLDALNKVIEKNLFSADLILSDKKALTKFEYCCAIQSLKQPRRRYNRCVNTRANHRHISRGHFNVKYK